MLAILALVFSFACPPDNVGAPCLDYWNVAPHAGGDPLICFNADWDGDGFLTPDDISDYITDFYTQMALPVPMGCADVDCNGLDEDDLSTWITLFYDCLNTHQP